MTVLPYALLTFSCLATVHVAAQAAEPTAIFPFAFDDTSLQGQVQGVRVDEQARLSILDTDLRDALVRSGCCAPVTLAPVAEEVRSINLLSCNGCEVDLARKAGATISVTGWVQKVSNLILNINVVARNTQTGKVIGSGSVDIRGNTGESWSRGLSYLVRNRLNPADWR